MNPLSHGLLPKHDILFGSHTYKIVLEHIYYKKKYYYK